MDETTVYAVRVNFSLGAAAFAEGYALLPEIRRAKVDFFTYRRGKVVALVSGLLIRWCLEQRLGHPLTPGELAVDAAGKPFLRGSQNLHFNISHAGDYVVCAVAGCPVGIDIEAETIIDCEGIARFAYNAADHRAWRAQPPEDKLAYFYRLWTLKESLSKAVGLGLSLDTKNICFSRAGNLPEICRVELAVGQERSVWYGKHYHGITGHTLALCLPEPVFPKQVKVVGVEDLYAGLKKLNF